MAWALFEAVAPSWMPAAEMTTMWVLPGQGVGGAKLH